MQVVSSLAGARVDGGMSSISYDKQRRLACQPLIYSFCGVTDHEPAGLAQPPLPRALPRTLRNLVTGHSGEQRASAGQQIKRDIFSNPCRHFESVIHSLGWAFCNEGSDYSHLSCVAFLRSFHSLLVSVDLIAEELKTF